MKKSFISIGIIVGAACALMAFGFTTGNGKVIDEHRDVKNFQKISVSGAGTVILTHGNEFSCVVSLDSNLQKLYETKVSSGTLSLGFKPGNSINHLRKLEVRITMPDLKRIEGSGAIRIELENQFSGDELSVKLSGASKLQGNLAEKIMGMEASGNSVISLNGEYGDIAVDFSGASSLKVNGSALGLTGQLSGASSLDFSECNLTDADINASGASDINLGLVAKSIKTDLSGACRLRYKGNPSLDQRISGGSTIQKENG